MEILAEILVALLQFVGEIVLQLLFEWLAELGIRIFHRRKEAPVPRPAILSAIGYFALGGLVGGLSLVILPESLIQEEWLRRLNLLVAPLVAGLAMAMIGAWRSKRGQDLIRLDQFNFGFVFALAMTLVRYFLA